MKYRIIEENGKIKVQKLDEFLFMKIWKTCQDEGFLEDLYPPYDCKSDITFINREEAQDFIDCEFKQTRSLYKKRREEDFSQLIKAMNNKKCNHEFESFSLSGKLTIQCKYCNKEAKTLNTYQGANDINNVKFKYVIEK